MTEQLERLLRICQQKIGQAVLHRWRNIMNSLLGQRFLVAYSALLTLAFAVVVLGGFASQNGKMTLDEIDVHRINVVEPDGTLRMVISNQDRFPGFIIQGKEYPNAERKAAGALFYNNEGTEAGGLIYGSAKDTNGKLKEANVHLSFDQYMQDQVFSVDAARQGSEKFTTLRINDVGDYSILESIKANERISKLPGDQQETEWNKFMAAHPGNNPRIMLGRADDKSAVLQLKDTEGRNRIILKVAADGTPSMQFLNADGHVVKMIGATMQP